jgi:hypothetical protein
MADHTLQVGDRVRWRHPEPGVDANELNGEVVELHDDGEVAVKYDAGYIDNEDPDDLIKVDA